MSTSYGYLCTDCDEEWDRHGADGAWRREELAAWWQARTALAALFSTLAVTKGNLTIDGLGQTDFHGRAAWLARHAEHRIVIVDEYGGLADPEAILEEVTPPTPRQVAEGWLWAVCEAHGYATPGVTDEEVKDLEQRMRYAR